MTQPEQEPEFIKHEVESAEDWSEWVCPNPHKYLMKCCDCGSVHEAQFSVVRYKSEEEREACNFVDDPNLQAVFRMRRSKQWSPEDTAHNAICALLRQANDALALTSYPPQRKPLTDEQIMECAWGLFEDANAVPVRYFARAIEAAHGIKE